jgi:hypothetical protein
MQKRYGIFYDSDRLYRDDEKITRSSFNTIVRISKISIPVSTRTLTENERVTLI